jgi:hypothetical protein
VIPSAVKVELCSHHLVSMFLMIYKGTFCEFEDVMKNGVFWDVTLCGSCKNRRFSGTWRLGELGTTLAVTSNQRTLQRNTKWYLVFGTWYFFAACVSC